MADSSTQSSGNSTVSAFVTTLITQLIIFTVFILIFIALRKKQSRVYEPRTLVKTIPQELQPDQNPKGFLAWLTHVLKKPESFFIQQAGVDGYFFLRFLFIFGSICFLGASSYGQSYSHLQLQTQTTPKVSTF